MNEANYLEWDVDALDLEIGQILLKDELGSKRISLAEIKETAQRWLKLKLANIRTSICDNPIVQNHLTDKSDQNRNELFAAVVDAISKASGLIDGVPVALLAARVIHYGIAEICQTESS